MDELKPTHCWVTRTIWPKGRESDRKTLIVEFEDQTDEAMAKTFIEILIDLGHELDIYTDFSPLKMEPGRYILNGPGGFAVVEIDPAWTEEQIAQMEALAEEAAPKLDIKTWGDIFDFSKAQSDS